MNGVIRLRVDMARRTRTMFRIMLPAVAAALAVQAVVGTEPNTLAWAGMSAIVVLLTLGYCFRPGLFDRLPLSTLAIVGFDAVTLAIPLLAQSATGRSLLYGLRDPEETFPWIFATHGVIVGTHWLYSTFSPLQQPGRVLASRVFAPLSLFRMPSAPELWLLGLLGLVTSLASQVLYVNSIEYGDVGGKALSGFVFFTAFPFLIPMRNVFSGRQLPSSLATMPALIAYFGVIIIGGMAANKRLFFSFLGLTILVALLLIAAMGRLKVSGKSVIIAVFLLIPALPAFTFFENLATSMEMVRGAKGSLSGTGYIGATIDQLGDQAAIDRWRNDNEAQTFGALDYSDEYISINLLNRLVFLKYTDLTMAASSHLGPQQKDVLKDDFRLRLQAILPTPIAQAIGINLNKSDIEYSSGDVYENLLAGTPLVSFLTGSSITYSKDIWGDYWLILTALLYLIIFNSCDMLLLYARGRLIIAPCAILFLFQIFVHTCVNDSVADLIDGATRGALQTIALYLIVSTLIRGLLSASGVRASAPVTA